jgi:ATP-dependent RNA helicase HelY
MAVRGHDFALDEFQIDAIAALDRGESVLVSAPTGSGKTVVAEAAIDLALATRGRVFYTAPIKALSNQKYLDLRERLGADAVGLLTGDNAIDGDAPVVVMTTEVLRNMIYARSDALDGLHYVILDEVHFLQDTYRGPVWEEVIIHLPPSVRLVCLSATVSNAAELGAWIETVRGPTATIVETTRPVQLDPLYLVGDRQSERDHLLPLLIDGRPNPEGHRFTDDPRVARQRGARLRRRFVTPRRVETLERLDDEGLLPAIVFIFSRAACDDAAAQCRDAGLRFTDQHERQQIRALVEERTAGLLDADLDVLGYDGWLASLEMGIAAHHAGLIPAFKECVEACFTAGLVKVVFATETLALGVNMPARAVVIERLTKYNGETHEFLTPGEFTQLTGRAGRRGIDDEGFAVVLWSPFVSFDQVAGLAASRSFPLRSAFRATYNMTANLVRRHPRPEALEVLGRSFAQYQADAASSGLQSRLAADLRRRDELAAAVACERGDVEEYAQLVQRATRARRGPPGSAKAIEESVALLRPGDVVDAPEPVGTRGVVISVAYRAKGSIRVRVVDHAAEVGQFDLRDLTAPIRAVGRVELPVPYAPGDKAFLRGCADALATVDAPPSPSAVASPSVDAAEAAVVVHPVHRCPDRAAHLESLAEHRRVDKEIHDLSTAMARRSGSVVRRFESVVALLERRGYVAEWSLTSAGARLAAIFHECDLLVAECLGAGVLDDLEPAELAAVVSCFTYEERRPDAPTDLRMPTAEVERRVAQIRSTADTLRRDERSGGLPPTREPDAGFAGALHAWVAGAELDGVLGDDRAPGDFVRNVKVTVDLLRQLGDLAPVPGTAAAARAAVDAAMRGVIAASGEIETLTTSGGEGA